MTDSSPPPAPERGSRIVVAAVGIAAALAVGATAVLTFGDRSPASPAPLSTTSTIDLEVTQDEVGADFLADWHRWRTAEVLVRGTFSRQLPDGDRLESPMVVAQRGDQRLVSRLGGVEGFDGGDQIRCVPEVSGTTRCDRIADGVDAETRRREELETWADYLSGSPPYYRILRTDDGCYELVLTRALPTADFGTVARFCFDERSGALATTRLEYSNGVVELTEAEYIATTVDDTVFEALLVEPASA